jgi:hypothetical protein
MLSLMNSAARQTAAAVEWNTKDLPIDRIAHILGWSIEALQKMTRGDAELGAARAWACNEREYFAAYTSLAALKR